VERFTSTLRNLAGVSDGWFSRQRLSWEKLLLSCSRSLTRKDRPASEATGLKVFTAGWDQGGEDLVLSPRTRLVLRCRAPGLQTRTGSAGPAGHSRGRRQALFQDGVTWKCWRKGRRLGSFRVFVNDRDTFEYAVTCRPGAVLPADSRANCQLPAAGLYADAFFGSSGVSFMTAESVVVLDSWIQYLNFQSTGSTPAPPGTPWVWIGSVSRALSPWRVVISKSPIRGN